MFCSGPEGLEGYSAEWAPPLFLYHVPLPPPCIPTLTYSRACDVSQPAQQPPRPATLPRREITEICLLPVVVSLAAILLGAHSAVAPIRACRS
jgi:hypothetical protein